MMRAMIVVGVSLCLYSASALAIEPEACVPSKEKVKLAFRDTPLIEVVEFFSVVTCKKFIVTAKVQHELITLLSAAPVSTEDAFKVFEAALNTAGVFMTPEGKFFKLDVKSAQSASSSVGASVLELSFVEGKTTSIYKVSAPEENRASRFELNTEEQKLSFEFFRSTKKGVIEYEVMRKQGKDESASLALFGTIKVPASGKVSLLESSALSLYLNFVP
jgi:type II secretory pathway component GspD/PulD (secretin)